MIKRSVDESASVYLSGRELVGPLQQQVDHLYLENTGVSVLGSCLSFWGLYAPFVFCIPSVRRAHRLS